MVKIAGFESSEKTDPRNDKDIYISVTARKIFRKMYPRFSNTRNNIVNEIIANDFIKNTNNVIHLFWLDKEKRVIAEIRKGFSGVFYISAIRNNRVDILTFQSSWLKPKYKKVSPIEMGDE